jgi:hypothetical protein
MFPEVWTAFFFLGIQMRRSRSIRFNINIGASRWTTEHSPTGKTSSLRFQSKGARLSTANIVPLRGAKPSIA